MDTGDHTHLQARCTRLEHALLAVERALDDRTLAVDDVERLRLTACQERYLAKLGGINTRLSALRDSAAPT